MAFLFSRQSPPSSQDFTLQTGIGTSTLAAQFTAISGNSMDGPTPFTGIGASQSSVLASLKSNLNSDSKTSLLSSSSSSSPSSSAPTTLATSTVPSTTSGPTATPASSASSGSNPVSTSSPASTSAASSETSSAASASGAGTTTTSTTSSSAAANDGSALAKSTTGGGLSSGTKAAIAVPVVLVALAAIILAILCIRRRKRKRQETGEPAEKVPLASRNRKWTRHLRIFSFDTELLMGGRYSSTNSIRSRQTGSVRSQTPSQNSQAASVHSVDEVAPPYRDAISSAQPPSIGQVMAGGVAAGAAGGVAAAAVNRSASTATAPPPYGAGANRLAAPTSPASTLGGRNPFADSAPVSPVDSSPFNDPLGNSPAISRNSSVYHTERDETSTIGGASDAASIREATLARNASGRIINNVTKI